MIRGPETTTGRYQAYDRPVAKAAHIVLFTFNTIQELLLPIVTFPRLDSRGWRE